MANGPYNKLGYGMAQVLPENQYSPLARLMQTGWTPGSTKTKRERERFEQDRRKELNLKEVEAWEDVQSHSEISNEMDKLRDVWNQSFASGFNIANPRSREELQLQKAFNAKMTQVKQASDLYSGQGERYKSLQGIMDKEKDRIDMERTQSNVDEWMKKDVFGRSKDFDQLVSYKSKPFDVVSHTITNLSQLANVDEEVLRQGYNQKTGKIEVETLKHIPEGRRMSALKQIWQFGNQVPGFKEAVAQAAAEDITFNADPEAPDYDQRLGEWYTDQFREAKSGESRRVRMYSTGEGAGVGLQTGSGIPRRDPDSGMYEEESDTIHIFNTPAGGITEHTSPAAVNLQGEEMYGKNVPSNALQVDITDDFINTQSGDPEAEGGIYSMMPTKVVWLNVMDKDVMPQGGVSILSRRPKYAKGQVIDDEQLAEMQELNESLIGTGNYYTYRKVPFIVGRTKYGQVEAGDKIETFNRSTRVPYEVIEKDIRAHKGNKWQQYHESIERITRQLNSGWGNVGAEKKSSFDY